MEHVCLWHLQWGTQYFHHGWYEAHKDHTRETEVSSWASSEIRGAGKWDLKYVKPFQKTTLFRNVRGWDTRNYYSKCCLHEFEMHRNHVRKKEREGSGRSSEMHEIIWQSYGRPLQKSVKNIENLRVDPYKMHWNHMRIEKCDGSEGEMHEIMNKPYGTLTKIC